MPVILAIGRLKLGGSQFEVSPISTSSWMWWCDELVIPARQETGVRRIVGPGQPLAEKICKTSSQQKKNWVWWCTPVIPAMVESIK
jgi:hypothetical protein